ncbi:Lsr2 family protein [Gordonia alkaliphila]|uniref:histone-like nucleoid-structuring protein Lsr2 n=1 Tax=Gordonia alkaliphila TaxID=1053547 RepID=UPI001FF232B3|nr:Lsr2 family protein [Gordonia alkaliphila]MCK0441160.1 Lsr2 family protein [Gordonia alkaliphila]
MQKNIVQFYDDVTGEPINADDLEVIEFSVGNMLYRLDLSEESARDFHAHMDEYISKAQRVGRGRGRKPAARTPGGAGETRKIRQWAANNGYTVSDRGRIPAEIVAAYEAAN